MLQTMRTPSTRAEFERNFHLLIEQIKRGKFHFPKGMTAGILKVRFLPNGRIDFLSVDETARLEANMAAQFSREDINAMIEKTGTSASSETASSAAPDGE